jgi:hypothetical protein
MCHVLARLEREGVLTFFEKARVQSNVPKKTFEEVERLVVSLGCTPAQCIHVNAQQWLSPNARATNPIGANRHQVAGTMLRHIIKHLQIACSKCGTPHGHLTARQLTSIDLDHHGATKFFPARCSKFSIADAVREYAKCESTCSACHVHDGI